MATDQLINKTQGDAIIAGLTAIKNAINDQPVPTQVEDVVSDAFDVGVSYVPGDYCIYENKLYKCDVAHHGAWDGNDFTLTNVGAELDTLNTALSDKIKFKDLSIGVNLASLKAHHQNIDSDTTLAPIQNKIFAARVIGCPTDESLTAQFICAVSSKSNGTGVNINILNIYSGAVSGTLYVRVYYYT